MASSSRDAAGCSLQDEVIVISDDSSDESPPKRRRGGPRGGSRGGSRGGYRGGPRASRQDPDGEPSCSSSGPKRRRTPKKADVDSVASSRRKSKGTEAELAELPTGWAALPQHLLTKAFRMMGNDDVISAGQSCRSWRAAAKQQSVWRSRQLCYDLPGSKNNWHAGAKAFRRTILFAPCLGRVSCPKTMEGSARNAISTQSTCQVRSAELNGQLQWTTKYLNRQRGTLEDLTLLNPKVAALKAALALPALKSLAVSYERDVTKEKYQQQKLGYLPFKYRVPGVPKGTTGRLQKLVCHPGIRSQAVESLVLANASTVQELGIHCLPVEALKRCTKLRRLMVKLNPANAADQAKLRQVLQGARLEYLAFIGTPSHSKDGCAALRASLLQQVRGRVVCSACENVCTLERPRFASRDVPDLEVDLGPFDFLANMFRAYGSCQCNSCAMEQTDWGYEDFDDYPGYYDTGFDDLGYDDFF